MESKPLNVNIVSEICGYEWFLSFLYVCLYFPSFGPQTWQTSWRFVQTCIYIYTNTLKFKASVPH